MKNLLTIILLILLSNHFAFPQSKSEEQVRLSAEVGLGKAYIIDEFISKNEYTGYPSFYGLGWEDLNSFRETGFGFSYSKANNLKNRNTQAEVSELLFDYHYIYKIDTINVFSLPVKFYLGPGIYVYEYKRDQEIASFVKASSDFGSFSLNINSRFVYDISPNIIFKFGVSTALISYASGDRKSETEKRSGMFLFYSYLILNSLISVDYFITKNIFIELQYGFDYLRMNKLNKIRSINDRIILKAGWAF